MSIYSRAQRWHTQASTHTMNASLRQMNALVVSTPSPLILIFDISESMEASLQCVLHFLYILDLVLKDDIVKNEI